MVMAGHRKEPIAGFWLTVALVAVLVVYPLSFGPACWLAKREIIRYQDVWRAYHPVVRAIWDGPAWIRDSIEWYAALWAGSHTVMIINVNEWAHRGYTTTDYPPSMDR